VTVPPTYPSPSNFPRAAKRAARNSDRACRSGKVGYRTKRKARLVLQALIANDGPERFVYRCPLCSSWHLTKQDRRAGRAARRYQERRA